MSDIATAEQLWTRAHELVKRGEFADAVRDLAQAFQILQAANDPRLYEVHRRWTEVHQMYVEDGARAQQRQPAQETPSVEAEAEAAANEGNLEKAIALYESVVRAKPTHELARERLQELVQARARAHDLATGRSVEPTAAATQPPSASAPPSAVANPTSVPTAASEDDWSDVAVDDSGPRAASPGAAVTAAGAAAAEPAIAEVALVEVAVAEVAVAEVAVTDSLITESVTAEPQPAPSASSDRVGSDTVGSDEVGFDVKFSDEMSFADLNEPAAARPAETAPAMAPEDAPVGMQSLDVPFSVGAAISADTADELPVTGPPTGLPTGLPTSGALDAPSDTSNAAKVAFLEDLLARVQKNRRVA